MTTDPPAPGRVLLLAGCFADAAPSIGLAVALAARMRASIEAVLALDARAEGAALVPFGRPRGAPPPALSRESLTLSYAADARAFRLRLDKAAAGASLRWSFRTESGLLPDLALGMWQPGDAVIFGHRRFLALRGPVVSLGGDQDGSASRLAGDLARALGLRARVLPAETPPAQLDALAASALVLPRSFQTDRRLLAALIEAARCPVLLGPAE